MNNTVKVGIKKLVKHAQIPEYATPGAVGLDLIATDHCFDPDKKYHEYGTGIAIELPPGFVADVRPRSSISSKVDLVLINSPGTIDGDYRGEIMVRFKEINSYVVNPRIYEVGERIAQLVILPVPKVEFEEQAELSETDRGDGGFGSTGQ